MYKKILLIELAGIGDVVLSSAAIRNLKKGYPNSHIYFLTLPLPASLLEKSADLDKVFVFQKGFIGVIRNILVLNELRRLSIDIVINLYQHYTLSGALRMTLLLRFINPKQTLGRNTDGRGSFYDIRIEDTINTKRHDVEYKLDLIQALGCDIKDRRLEVWFDDFDKNMVKEFLENNLISKSDLLIGINPGARRPSHRWDYENFAKVANILSVRYGAKILITILKEDSCLAKRISSKMSTQPIVASVDLPLLAPLIRRCKLYISNDTAPMHIANALSVPLVAIMGPGTLKTAPYQKDNCIVLKKDVDCYPCYRFRCKDKKCLRAITVDDVLHASEILLKNHVKI